MTNFFYTDANGERQGPITSRELKSLAARGIINPTTPLETEGGRKGLAGQIPALSFNTSTVPPLVPRENEAAPAPAKQCFCTNCGHSVFEQAYACLSCGARPVGHRKFCRHCSVALNPEQIVCIQCGEKVGGFTAGVESAVSTLSGMGKSLTDKATPYAKTTCSSLSNAMKAFFAKVIPYTKAAWGASLAWCKSFFGKVTGYFKSQQERTVPGPTDSGRAPDGEKPAFQEEISKPNLVVPHPAQSVRVSREASLPVAPIASVVTTNHPPVIANQIKKLQNYYKWLLICLVISPLTFGASIIAEVIILYVLLYHLWKLIPEGIARTSPGQAVGFCFLPVFNIYWISFVAYKGLGEDMNKTLAQRGIPYRTNERLGKTFCILVLCTFACCIIPVIGWILLPPIAITSGIVLLFFLKSLKDGGIALLGQSNGSQMLEQNPPTPASRTLG